MAYYCSQENINGVEMHHCSADNTDDGCLMSLCHQIGADNSHFICQIRQARGTVRTSYFATRADALAALSVIDPEHGLV